MARRQQRLRRNGLLADLGRATPPSRDPPRHSNWSGRRTRPAAGRVSGSAGRRGVGAAPSHRPLAPVWLINPQQGEAVRSVGTMYTWRASGRRGRPVDATPAAGAEPHPTSNLTPPVGQLPRSVEATYSRRSRPALRPDIGDGRPGRCRRLTPAWSRRRLHGTGRPGLGGRRRVAWLDGRVKTFEELFAELPGEGRGPYPGLGTVAALERGCTRSARRSSRRRPRPGWPPSTRVRAGAERGDLAAALPDPGADARPAA